jgi:hypothetical protein
LGALLLNELYFLDDLPLRRIEEGSRQLARLDLALDQVILRALLNRLNRNLLVVRTGQQHDRDAGRSRTHAPNDIKSMRIGQSQV